MRTKVRCESSYEKKKKNKKRKEAKQCYLSTASSEMLARVLVSNEKERKVDLLQL